MREKDSSGIRIGTLQLEIGGTMMSSPKLSRMNRARLSQANHTTAIGASDNQTDAAFGKSQATRMVLFHLT